MLRILPRSCDFMDFKKRFLKLPLLAHLPIYLIKNEYFHIVILGVYTAIECVKKKKNTYNFLMLRHKILHVCISNIPNVPSGAMV